MTGSCTNNHDCSGHGECFNGFCVCEIRFSGEYCDHLNIPYHTGIGGVFFMVALVCIIQLVMCILSEYQRLKNPTFGKACKVTTQKLLYLVAFLASLLRGAYFTQIDTEHGESEWSNSLLSAYYPLLMSASSLIVCFWAEVFHLRNVRWEKPQFLSKSFLAFVTFNLITYSLFFIELVTTNHANTSNELKHYYTQIFNGCYAVLLFIVVVFFLIYGVEVFIKVRGGFLVDALSIKTRKFNRRKKPNEIIYLNNLTSTSASSSEKTKKPIHQVYNEIILDPSSNQNNDIYGKINISQLHQSRIGLISMAFMLMIIVGFLCSETLSELWKKKVPVNSRNWHDVLFRTVELGVAVWFPCVLWNCFQPSELWILNPRKLLNKLEQTGEKISGSGDQKDIGDDDLNTRRPFLSTHGDEEQEGSSLFLNRKECWICCDLDIGDEDLIQPCECKGDVSHVHLNCLRRWLMESAASNPGDYLRCKVCRCFYKVEESTRLDWDKCFTAQHWLSTIAIVSLMCVSLVGAWIAVQLYDGSYVRILSLSFAMLVVYICIRFLGLNTVSAYQRAKISAINIVSPIMSKSATDVSTISESYVAVNINRSPNNPTPI